MSEFGIYDDDDELNIAQRDKLARRSTVEALRVARLRLGLTQADVAARMSVTQRTVSTFERVTNDPLLSSLQRYADAIGARIDVRIVEPVEPVEGER